jgi:hypothetical protein
MVRSVRGHVVQDDKYCSSNCGTFEYLYDDYASLEATGRVPYDPVMEARLVAVSGYSLFQEKARDDFRLKGWVGGWSTTPPTGSSEAWFEECESHYQDYLFCGRAKRLLGRTWVFALRRNLASLHAQLHSTDFLARDPSPCL